MENRVIWCWSLSDPNNTIFIFRGFKEKEIKIDFKEFKGTTTIKKTWLLKKEQELVKKIRKDYNL